MDPHIDDISTSSLDWSGASADYARHRAGFPDELYDRLAARGLLRAGARAVDLGTGTGTVAIALADRGLIVTALDVAAGQLEAARRLAGARPITFVRAPAEHTGLPAEGFELVTAGQCWHWLDRATAAREVARVLAPGGAIAIAHLDWIERPGTLVAETVALVDAHRTIAPLGHEALAVRGLYPYWLEDLYAAGFGAIESFSFDVPVPYGRESWRGRIRASAYVGAAMDAAGVARVDRALATLLERHPETFDVPHRVFVALARRERAS